MVIIVAAAPPPLPPPPSALPLHALGPFHLLRALCAPPVTLLCALGHHHAAFLCLPTHEHPRGYQEALAAARPPLLVEDNLLHLSIVLRVLRACHGCHAHYSQGACIQELWTPTTLHGVAMLRPHLASHMYTRSLGAT